MLHIRVETFKINIKTSSQLVGLDFEFIIRVEAVATIWKQKFKEDKKLQVQFCKSRTVSQKVLPSPDAQWCCGLHCL